MRRWTYQDPSGTYTFTEEEIIASYYPFWWREMQKVWPMPCLSRFGGDPLSPEWCLEDWLVVHWAWEVDGMTT